MAKAGDSVKKAFIISIMLIFVVLIVSCGGVRDQRYIKLTDPIGNDSVRIRVDAKRVAYRWLFSTHMDIFELAEEIGRKNTRLTTEVYHGNMIVITTRTNIFYIYQSEEYGEYIGSSFRYAIGSTSGFFLYSPVEMSSRNWSGTLAQVYLPYHLLRGLPGHGYPFIDITPIPVDDNDESIDFTLRNTIECEALGDVDDFIEFYNRIKFCDIEVRGDTLVVTNKKNEYVLEITFSQDAEFFIVTFSVLVDSLISTPAMQRDGSSVLSQQ